MVYNAFMGFSIWPQKTVMNTLKHIAFTAISMSIRLLCSTSRTTRTHRESILKGVIVQIVFLVSFVLVPNALAIWGYTSIFDVYYNQTRSFLTRKASLILGSKPHEWLEIISSLLFQIRTTAPGLRSQRFTDSQLRQHNYKMDVDIKIRYHLVVMWHTCTFQLSSSHPQNRNRRWDTWWSTVKWMIARLIYVGFDVPKTGNMHDIYGVHALDMRTHRLTYLAQSCTRSFIFLCFIMVHLRVITSNMFTP